MKLQPREENIVSEWWIDTAQIQRTLLQKSEFS